MGIPRDALIERVFDVWCKMILRDGYYHADPHPGNLLVQADGTLVILDFGATASVSANMRSGISGIIEAAIKSDSDTMVEACRKMGIVAEGREAEKMAKQIIAALRNFLQNEVKVEGLNFQDISINPFNNSLSDLIQDIGFNGIAGTVQIPKDYVLLNRALMLLLGISNTVAPGFNPLTVVRPHVRHDGGHAVGISLASALCAAWDLVDSRGRGTSRTRVVTVLDRQIGPNELLQPGATWLQRLES